MRFSGIIATVSTLLVLASGCDTVRSFLGKPTSSDIERMRAELERVEKERSDSLARAAEAARADSLQRVAEQMVARRYNVIAGAFSEKGNIDSFKTSLIKAGYNPFDIEFKNGVVAVCVMSSDDYNEALRFLGGFRSGFELGEDAWIYTIR